MKIRIQKYGGTSVQTKESRKYVIHHIKKVIKKGYKVVVVVSAMGRKPDPYATDSLLKLVDYPKHSSSKRELDLLMSCGEIISAVVLSNELKKQSIQAKALTGAQAGILTNDRFSEAKVKEVRTECILKDLESYDALIVAGFQGQTDSGEITTIGRGGSDTTAAALGAALRADRIDVFTDVNGVMTADPRVVEKARPLKVMTYAEICNLAYQGAKVIHPRAAEIALQAKIPIRIRATYKEDLGTLITNAYTFEQELQIEDRLVTGIAYMSSLTQIKIPIEENALHQPSYIFKAMAEAGISVDFINISPSNVVYTVPDHLQKQAVTVLKENGFNPEVTENCAKVSTVGAGMTGVPGVALKIIQALTNENIQILQSADSHTTIWVLIKNKDLTTAVNALHDAFGLCDN